MSSGSPSPAARPAQAIRGWLMPRTNMIALDEDGTQMTRRGLATELGRARDQCLASAAFVVGVRDGLELAFLASTLLTLSLGAMP
jgi:23S rRNA pseudoU1915 N3-methylase RlmH